MTYGHICECVYTIHRKNIEYGLLRGQERSVFTVCGHRTHTLCKSVEVPRKSVVIPWYHYGLTQTLQHVCGVHTVQIQTLLTLYSWTFFPVIIINCLFTSLVPRLYIQEKRAWYTLLAHALFLHGNPQKNVGYYNMLS